MKERNINYVEVSSSLATSRMEKRGDSFQWKDVTVNIDEYGTVRITACQTPISKVRILFQNKKFHNGKVLGDAWERGYGDLEWKIPNIHNIMPWYFLAYCNGRIYGYGVKTQPDALCSWNCDYDEIVLNIDIRNGTEPIILDGNTIEACRIVFGEYEGDVNTAAFSFCKEMCDCPRLPSMKTIYGGNDWYCNYGNTSYEKILSHTKKIVECSKEAVGVPFMVIDDGWQAYHFSSEKEYYNGGPWDKCNDRFPDMNTMAEAILNEGAIPGIWIRPLLTVGKKPEYSILRTEGRGVVMDPSSPETLACVYDDIRRIREWGYRLIKHDFTTRDIFGVYGFEFGDNSPEIKFFDKTKTTAQIIKQLYQTIRDAAGDDVLVMGCNTISHLSAGFFELQRTGDDTSGIEWERTKKYGINTLAFRMAQHNSFYYADADCVGITTDIPWKLNRQWLDVLEKSGTALFVSIAEDAYTDEVKKDIQNAFERASKNTEPSHAVDWMESNSPSVWESMYGIDRYNW